MFNKHHSGGGGLWSVAVHVWGCGGLVYGNPLYFLLSFAMNLNCSKNKLFPDFPGGPVVGSPPANAVDRGSIPVAGRVHMLKGS